MTTKGKTAAELEALGAYLEAAQAYAPLSREEERELGIRARAGDAAARDELVRRHLPLVIGFARKQARGSLRLEELVQEGNIGLLHAVEKFDPNAGTRFSTYAVWWIRAYVWKYLKLARSSVRPKSGTVAREDLSLDHPIDAEGESTYLDHLEDDAPSPHARYVRAQDDALLRQRLAQARGRIGELGWDIIHSRLKQDPPETLEQIGRRWNLSRERVRQVELQTKRFLKEYLQPADDVQRAA